jgi:hypothetical protein
MPLLMHASGSNRAFNVEIETLDQFEKPEQTRTYQPLSHSDMIQWTIESAKKVGLKPKPFTFQKVEGYDVANNPIIKTVTQEAQVGVTSSGHRMFFLIDFEDEYLSHSFQVGGRNSYDKSLAAGVVAGARNIVCDNTCLSGSFQVLQKHMNSVNYFQIISDAVSTAPRNTENLIHQIEQLKDVKFTDLDEVKTFIFDSTRVHQAISATDMIPVWNEFVEPSHEEFTEFGLSHYRLLQAYTEHNKKEGSPNVAINRYLKFAHLFGLGNDLN